MEGNILEDNALKLTWEKYVKTKDQQEKNKLIIHYLPLVKATAARLSVSLPAHINIDDLISSGVFGLISAIERYKPGLGTKFKSFSNLRIYGSMLDELRNLDWVPRSIRSKSRQLQEAYNAVQQQKGRFALDSEVADFLGVTAEEFTDMISKTKIVTIISLDAKIYNNKSNNAGSFSDVVEDKKTLTAHFKLSKKETKEILVNAIEELSKQEKIVLTLYYFDELTLKEIGEVLSVTESRVSQIHSKAIHRLKARLNLSEVADYAAN